MLVTVNEVQLMLWGFPIAVSSKGKPSSRNDHVFEKKEHGE
jgi:hypothetical protein